MSAPLLRLCAFVFVAFTLSSAHPVFQRHFNRIVNANPCLKKCMDEATADDVELSLLKTANVSGYLLNVEIICSTISSARSCISGCGVESNPFTLESTTAICSPQALAEIASITPCLQQQGNAFIDQCEQECGDYDQINEEVDQLTKSMHPDINEPQKLAQAMSKINQACGTLKCSDRCVSKAMTEQCPPLAGGANAGQVLRGLIERVLVAQRRDLERMKLVDAMAQSVPVQCNYMFMPEVLFNSTKDELSMVVISETHRSEQLKKQAQNLIQGSQDAEKRQQHAALSQFQSQLFKKQLDLLSLQEKNVAKEGRKLDLELQLLQRKRMQMDSDENMIKQF